MNSLRRPLNAVGRQNRPDRSGTVIVEAAIVLPVYLLVLFAIIEFGHAQLVLSLLQSGCRNGARMGSMQGPSSSDVVTRVKQTLGSAVDPTKVSVFVRDADIFDTSSTPPSTDSGIEALPSIELSTTEPRRLFVVRASVPYNSIALVPMPFLKNVVLDSQSFMRHE